MNHDYTESQVTIAMRKYEEIRIVLIRQIILRTK